MRNVLAMISAHKFCLIFSFSLSPLLALPVSARDLSAQDKLAAKTLDSEIADGDGFVANVFGVFEQSKRRGYAIEGLVGVGGLGA